MNRLSEAYSKLRLLCANLVSSLDDWYYNMQEERDNTKADEKYSNFVDFDRLKESQFVKKSLIGFNYIADILKNFWNLDELHLKKPSFGNWNWKISQRARILAIGWFNFLVCFIPFVAVLCYSITGAVYLDDFLYNRAIVKLSDFITDRDLLKFVHKILFVAGGGSIFFLIIVGTILGIGVVFNGLLLVGAHTNNVTPVSVWIPYQRLLFVFDLYCLLVIVFTVYFYYYVFRISIIPTMALFQTARIFFRWWCIRNVNRHLKSLGSPESHKPQFYKTQFDKTQFDKTQFDKTQINLSPNNNTEAKPIDVSGLSKVIEAC